MNSQTSTSLLTPLTVMHRAQATCTLVGIIVIILIWPDWSITNLFTYLGPQALGMITGGLWYLVLLEATSE